MPTTDSVAEIVAQWGVERPDLDASPILVIGRLARLTQQLEPHLRPPFAEAGLGNGDFDVLAVLRRSGKPFTLTPSQLSDALLVTTGAVTKRVDRLEQRRFVRRVVSGADARGRLISLTRSGRTLTDTLIETHLANERRMLSGLSVRERTTLEGLLARLTATIDEP